MRLSAPEDPDLRQGDVCTLDGFPTWELGRVSVLNDPDGKRRLVLPELSRVVPDGTDILVAVCSQCCDLRRPGKRSGILIAPLRLPPFKPDDETLRDELVQSRAPEGERWMHISLFPVMVPQPPDDDLLAVVDLSQMIALRPPQKAVDDLLSRRRFALTEDERAQFRTKAAALIGRPPNEVED